VWQQTDDSEDPDTGVVEVAVKTMEEGASEDERVKFLQEAAIMGQFKNHPNIVRILGIILDAPVSNFKFVDTRPNNA
jgi:serine/threonine protein kinase